MTENSIHKKIIFLGSNERAALLTARSIKKSFDLDIFIIYFFYQALANYSNTCKGSLYFGNPQIDYTGFLTKFIDHIARNKYELLIPIDDPANEIVFNNYETIVKHVLVAGPSPRAYRKVHSKYESVRIAEKLNIKVPDFCLLENGKELNLENINFPVFAKPEFSCLLKNNFLHHRLYVRKIDSLKKLKIFVSEHILICKIMLQKQVDGFGVGLNIFAIEGKVTHSCVNVRIHEPQSGGRGSFRKTISLPQELKNYAELIATETNWTGLMMVEFKYDGKDYYLMEINPRPWGSIGLSAFSGIDFPAILVNYFMFGQSHPKDEYKLVYSRNVLEDLRWLLSRLIKNQELNVLAWLQFFIIPINVLLKRETLDIASLRDPLPMLMQFVIPLDRFRKKIFFKLNQVYNKFNYKSKLKEIKFEQINSGDRVLFVCKGNVNRSVFAQKYAEKYGVNAASAGTLLLSSRKANPVAMAIAEREYNLDLSGHVSKCITEILDIADFKYIFVFDFENYTKVVNMTSNLQNKIFLLGSKALTDPYGKSEEEYICCFSSIAQKIDNLVDFNLTMRNVDSLNKAIDRLN